MQAIEYRLSFATKAAAENALDYYENQPGYHGGRVLLPCAGQTNWRVAIFVAPEKLGVLADHRLLESLGVTAADNVKVAAARVAHSLPSL